MPLENLIIHLYCLACDAMASRPENQPLRSRGFAPALSDEEALCIEMAGEILGMDQDKQIHAYFKRHWLHFFPRLGCRTTFARQAANLWAAKREVHAALLAAFDGREASLFVADGFPCRHAAFRGPTSQSSSRARPPLAIARPKNRPSMAFGACC